MTRTAGPFVAISMASAILALSGSAFGQGLVNFSNTSETLVRTNSVGLGGTAGVTSGTSNSFFYGLFIAGSSVTNLAPGDLLTSSWTFTGLYGKNSGAPGRLFGGLGVPVFGWANTTNSFAVAGWSANVAGMDWGSVGFQLAGGVLNNGVWTGPDWQPASDGGFFGVSAVGYGLAPAPPDPRLPFNLFGVPYAMGVPIGTGFDLNVIHVPEPSSSGLTALGVLLVLGTRSSNTQRRRKRSFTRRLEILDHAGVC